MNKPIGIYIHIPFCSGKCGYCDFHSAPGTAAEMDDYTDALLAHIAQGPRYSADTLYFGGGTPSILGVRNLVRIVNAVREGFDLTPEAELTLEANPGDICLRAGDGGAHSLYALCILRSVGFNRISLGVQSGDEAMLRRLGRRHDFTAAQQAVKALRLAGFENLSLDAMYGLPGQSVAVWRESLGRIIALEPEHISCYALKLEPGTPLGRENPALPGDEEQLAMYLACAEDLAAAGYRQYEISNFARPGYASRHNQKYWQGAPYLGFGPGAHSYMDGARYAYAPDTAAYIARDYAPRGVQRISPAEGMEEALMLGLRTSAGFALDSLPEAARGRMERLIRKYSPHGLLYTEGGRLILTPRGMFVSNHIIGEALDALSD